MQWTYCPRGVILTTLITPEQYNENLSKVLSDVKTPNVTGGGTYAKPSEAQQTLMARLMNACGYSSTKWVGKNKGKESSYTRKRGWSRD